LVAAVIFSDVRPTALAAASPGYQVSGDLLYEVFLPNRPRKPLARQFLVRVDQGRWSIETALGDTNSNLAGFVDRYDGTNVYSIVHYRGSAYNKSSAKVERSEVPDAEYATGAAALWLAFASGAHLRALTTNNRLAPLWNLDDPALRAAAFTVPGKWSLAKSAPGLPLSVEFYDDGQGYYVRDGKRLSEPQPPPFDQGYLRASYRAFTFTNVGAWSIPRSFTYEEFRPDYERARSTNDLLRALRITVSGAVVRPDAGLAPGPVTFTDKVYVTDCRYLGIVGAPLQYMWTNLTLADTNHPVVSNALHQARQELRPQPQAVPNQPPAPRP
jgi:hypothetical protein